MNVGIRECARYIASPVEVRCTDGHDRGKFQRKDGFGTSSVENCAAP